MPKIIEDAQALIFETARRTLKEEGKNFSLRGIAKQCGISPGTVYNYYLDKSSLIEDIMADDWKKCYAEMCDQCRQAKTFHEAVSAVFIKIREITEIYRKTITADDMADTWFTLYGKRHTLLISILSGLLFETAEGMQLTFSRKSAEILSEMLVNCAQSPAYSESDIEEFTLKMNF